MNRVIEDIIGIIEDDTSEEWQYIRPKCGDHIRVQRRVQHLDIYSHHGVYISDEEVIHFAGRDDDSIFDWSKCEVISTDLVEFLRGGTVEVKIYTNEELEDLYPVEYIVDYARSCLGDKGYHLVFNNCEHFANVCTLGRFRSKQVQRVFSGKMPLEDKRLPSDFEDIFGPLEEKIPSFLEDVFVSEKSFEEKMLTKTLEKILNLKR